MFLVLSLLPSILLAFTISTDVKVGDEICTNVDVSRHQILSDRLKLETKTSQLAPEDTLEGKALIKRYLELNQLRFSESERADMYLMHIQRMGVSEEQFSQYLVQNNLTKESFIEEMVYRQEILRWMIQTHSWKEVVTKAEIETLRSQMMSEATAANANTMTFEVLKLVDKDMFPPEVDESFWKDHASDNTVYKDVAVAQVPEPYESFLTSNDAGSISQPIQAFGYWHVIRIIDKPQANLPSDAMMQNYLMEQKCMKHLSSWTADQMKWMYKDK